MTTIKTFAVFAALAATTIAGAATAQRALIQPVDLDTLIEMGDANAIAGQNDYDTFNAQPAADIRLPYDADFGVPAIEYSEDGIALDVTVIR